MMIPTLETPVNNTGCFLDHDVVKTFQLFSPDGTRRDSRPACYLILDDTEDFYYVGSTSHISNRVASHRYQLLSGTHSNKKLQDAFDRCLDKSTFVIHAAIYSDVEEARDREQLILDEGHGSPVLLNISDNARAPVSGYDRSHVYEKLRIYGLQPHVVKKKAARMRERWENGPLRDQFLDKVGEKITVDGVSYSSVREASRKTGYAISALRNHLNNGVVNTADIIPFKRAVSAKGIIYDSMVSAANAFDIKDNTMHYRVNSKADKWVDFFYVTVE